MRRAAVPLLVLLACGLWLGGVAAGRAQTLVDLELVLAVDTSSSVSEAEFDLQMKGLAEAFRNPVIMEAVRASGDHGVAVALIQWSDAGEHVLAVDWRVLRSPADSAAFADALDTAPRFVAGGGTALGSAMDFAMRAILSNAYRASRSVIDVSGDGRANQGERPDEVRDRAILAGITVNGLAILNEDPNVGRYYKENVVGGTGAFVMSTNNYEDFSAAMMEKLVREISGPPIVQRRREEARPARQSAGKPPRHPPAR